MKKIACIGNITTDIIVKPADSIPESGTLRAVESIEMHVGGCASNAAIDLAKLGIEPTLICAIGNDNFGDFVKFTCEKNCINTCGVNTNSNTTTTGSVVCVNSTGERSFMYNPGSSAELCYDNIDIEIIKNNDIIFVAGAMLLKKFDGESCAKLMNDAQKMGKFTAMDTAWDYEDIWLPKIEAVLPHLDLFMPSYDEAVKITNETDINKIADFLFDKGVKTVIIKIGKDGALICESRDKRYILPTYTSIKPVDTTGAGDSFCAGFLAGLAMSWNYKKSGQLANAVGTHCIMTMGASTGIKSIEEIQKFMNENKKEVAIDD